MGIKEFAEHLAGKGLSFLTLQSYLAYYRLFDAGLSDHELNQSYVNRFLLKHPSSTARAFITNLFEFLEINHLKTPKITGAKKRKKRRSITPEDFVVLRNWIYYNENLRYVLCIELSYYCALRRAEVMGIKIEDFDLKNWQDTKKSCKLLIKGKGNRERFVPVPAKVMKRVIEYMLKEDKGMDDKLFKFNKSKWQDAFKRAVRSCMDYNFTLHDLRRSRATHWLKNGVDLIRVRDRLGHTSVKTTQVYINLSEEKEFEKWSEESDE